MKYAILYMVIGAVVATGVFYFVAFNPVSGELERLRGVRDRLEDRLEQTSDALDEADRRGERAREQLREATDDNRQLEAELERIRDELVELERSARASREYAAELADELESHGNTVGRVGEIAQEFARIVGGHE